MNRPKLGRDILILSIMTLLTTLTWIGSEVYRNYTKSTVPKIIKELTTPLNPAIDTTIIDDIEKKYHPSIEELDLPTAPISLPSELTTGEESTASQQATQSGNLN